MSWTGSLGDKGKSGKIKTMTKEEAAPVICQYGKDSRITSEEAAVQIIKALQKNSLSSFIYTPEKVQNVKSCIQEYRNGKSLEIVAEKIIDIIEAEDLYSGLDLSGVYGNSIGSIGVALYGIGDILIASVVPADELLLGLWVPTDGRELDSHNYMTLHYELSTNTKYKMYGFNFSERYDIKTGISYFKIPDVNGYYIKIC